nr:MAG TPA: hypothetical protein [Caudoviricetes sp.]
MTKENKVTFTDEPIEYSEPPEYWPNTNYGRPNEN